MGPIGQNKSFRYDKSRLIAQKERFDAQNRRIGALTGILLEDTNIKISKKDGISRNRMPSPDMWEMQ